MHTGSVRPPRVLLARFSPLCISCGSSLRRRFVRFRVCLVFRVLLGAAGSGPPAWAAAVPLPVSEIWLLGEGPPRLGPPGLTRCSAERSGGGGAFRLQRLGEFRSGPGGGLLDGSFFCVSPDAGGLFLSSPEEKRPSWMLSQMFRRWVQPPGASTSYRRSRCSSCCCRNFLNTATMLADIGELTPRNCSAANDEQKSSRIRRPKPRLLQLLLTSSVSRTGSR